MGKFRIGAAVAAAALSASIGCKMPEMTNEQFANVIQQAREIAKEQGVSWKASFVSGGDVGAYQSVKFGVDTGVRVEIHFQGNAAK